ncbi:MAG: MotA/TolQ/ExbB proton channel family protein [Planctomycetaceae bacterium]|nr:MAG: MotA/TolQ/ExbB proton channel family protein [Planctomycetaceae bacterium]
MQYLIDFANNSVYPAQGLLALYGVFQVILVLRRIKVKQFRTGKAADQFLEEVHAEVRQGKLDNVATLCDTPAYWAKAVPQLILVALANRDRDLGSIRRLLTESFDREVLSDLQYRMSWINTVIKSEPMLGLLGTVLGMIAAFGKIAGSDKSGVDPKLLANDISFALITTAVGLVVSIPLILAMSFIQVRLGRLLDHVQQYMAVFLEEFEASRAPRHEG